MESSCFVCGDGVVTEEVNITSLHLLFRILCQRLDLTDLRWEPVEGVHHSIFCGKCYDLLKSVERVHQIIVSAERELKTFLKEVEGLIAKSQWQKPSVSLRKPSIYEFRRRVAKKFAESGNVGGGLESVEIKEESATTDDDDHGLDDDFDTFLDNEHAPDDNLNDEAGTGTETKDLTSHATETGEEEVPVKTCRSVGRPKKNASSSLPPAKKRKVELENTNRNEEFGRRTSPRVAKKSAEQALKQYACSESEDDDADENYDQFGGRDESDEDETSDYKEEQTVSDAEDHVSDTENIGILNPKSPSKKDETTSNKSPKEKKKRIRGGFYAFVVAEENLFLYKWGTYVRFNYTHLQCKAFNCTFQTEFDYYPSFQRMKKHIEENHRDRKHFKIQHPCLKCNNLFPNQDSFRKHYRTAHESQFSQKADAVCECCLSHIKYVYARAHMFSHKNAEEKAAARAANDGSARCFLPKMSEMDDTQKKYKCDHENCTYATKSSKNLKRHKNSHLPPEERTDLSICTECGRRMLSESLATHMKRIHHPETVDRVSICPICDKRFLTCDKTSLLKHIRRHRNEKPFLCTECGASFVTGGDLNQHTQQVHSINEQPIKCQFCDKVFFKPRSCQVHMRRRHRDKINIGPSKRKLSKFYYNEELESAPQYGPIQQFPCPICDVPCKYRTTLKVHMGRFHSDGVSKVSRKAKIAKTTEFTNEDNIPGNSALMFPNPGPQYFGS